MGAVNMPRPILVMPFNPNYNVLGASEQAYKSALNSEDPDVGYVGGYISGLFNDITGRSAQQTLQSNAQEFDEYMYTQYNSPQALKRQFEEAGLNTNLLGSTSFGTAQSVSGAPAVNSLPLSSPTEAVKQLGEAASAFADPAFKKSQIPYYLSLDTLNQELINKYGKEAALTQQQYDFVKETWDWSVMNSEFTAKQAQQGYYNAVQMFNNLEQDWENKIKEGQVLDNEIERSKWEAKEKEEICNMLIEHGYYPDMDYLSRFFIDYVRTGDFSGFRRFLNGFQAMEDSKNKSAVKTGVANGKVKIAGQEIDTATLMWAIENGKDIMDLIDQKNTGWIDRVKGWFTSDKPDFSDSSSTDNREGYSNRQLRKFSEIDKLLSVALSKDEIDNPDEKVITDILRKEGYSYKDIADYLDYNGLR